MDDLPDSVPEPPPDPPQFGFFPVNLDNLDEEFHCDWTGKVLDYEVDLSMTSSPSVPSVFHTIQEPVISVLEDVRNSEEDGEISYASEAVKSEGNPMEIVEREMGTGTQWLQPPEEVKKVKRPLSPREATSNFRKDRFSKKLREVNSMEMSYNTAVEEDKKQVLEELKEEAQSLPVSFTFEEEAGLGSGREAVPVESAQEHLQPLDVVIEWEESASSKALPSPSLPLETTTVPSVAPFQSSSPPPSPKAIEVLEPTNPPISESEREQEALLTTVRVRTKLVTYRDVWPIYEKMNIRSYIRPEDNVNPIEKVSWWQKCCMGDAEEPEIHREEKKRVYVLMRVKVGEVERCWDMVMSIWKMCQGVNEDCNSLGSHWTSLGFTTPDPTATFNSTNLLGLLHLLYFTSRYTKTSRRVASNFQGKFPLARFSCVLTTAAVQALRDRKLDGWITGRYSAYDIVNFYYAGMMNYGLELRSKQPSAQWQALGQETVAAARRSPSTMLRYASTGSHS